MKFKFKVQQYQTDAVQAVADVFLGQGFNSEYAYKRDKGKASLAQTSLFEGANYIDDDGLGFGNAEITLTDEQLLANIRAVQEGRNIPLSEKLSRPLDKACRCALDIEMETGTGKTYCYTKTIFELNKKYGWSKFIVVVPSLAIREGVKKSFDITSDHFFDSYGKKARVFVYNSGNLTALDSFSSSKDIYVMIINSQAFATSLKQDGRSKEARIIYTEQDSFGSRRPIDVIAKNRPIVILDEPQKLGGSATQAGIQRFNPLFTLNYSATHRERHDLIYELDALDAFRKKLVKKIEVKGFKLRNLQGKDSYVYFSGVEVSPNKPPRARVEFEKETSSGINRTTRLLEKGDSLYELSGRMEQYRDKYTVGEINAVEGTITFLNGLTLHAEEAGGNVNEKDIRRIQIKETILSHFEKEARLFSMGIKCLSLFFIDEVAKYRQYDEGGNQLLGEYGKMFEEEYNAALSQVLTLEDTPYMRYLKGIPTQKTHAGYFSIDPKGKSINGKINKNGESEDTSAYDLILKNKERLLSFNEPTRFIFSHSALREGWDNPNVFQICTLKQSDNTVSKRQEVGRGMRLCVNQSGERMDDTVRGIEVHDINVLTVIASDSYESFVDGLQKEIKSTLHARPACIGTEYFTGKNVYDEQGGKRKLSAQDANKIQIWMAKHDYIDDGGKLTPAFEDALEGGSIAPLPAELQPYASSICAVISSASDGDMDKYIKQAGPYIKDNSVNDNFYKKQFQTLWNSINNKYAYNVTFSSAELIQNSISEIDDKLQVTPLMYERTVGSQDGDMQFSSGKTRSEKLRTASSSVQYDLVGKVAADTGLTRKTAASILQGIRPQKFALFRANPEEFIKKVCEIINSQKAAIVVNEITYNITERGAYDGSIFNVAKGSVSMDGVVEAKKHVTPYVITDSNTEVNFAKAMEADEGNVCVYAKLPKAFFIPTPMGNYTPDWAIAFEEGSVKHIYFVAETKGSLNSLQLREVERGKVACAERLFEKISSGNLKYGVVTSFEELLSIIK